MFVQPVNETSNLSSSATEVQNHFTDFHTSPPPVNHPQGQCSWQYDVNATRYVNVTNILFGLLICRLIPTSIKHKVDASYFSFVTLLCYFQRTNENKVYILHHSISCSADVIYITAALHIFQHTLSNAHEYISLKTTCDST
jgi:hypothetical protein